MKTIYEIDADGFMTFETVEIDDNEELPMGFVDVSLPTDDLGNQLPFWKPQWTGTEWIEARPQEEIDKEMNKSVPLTEIEKLQQENLLLKAQAQANADRADFQEEVLAEIILTIMP